MAKSNPNRIDRQKKSDSPPPASQGAREAPTDTTDWTAVGHDEAEAQRDSGDAVPSGSGSSPGGGGRRRPPRTGS